MNERASIGDYRRVLRLRGSEGRLQGRHLGSASCQLCGDGRKLRLEVNLELVDGFLQSVICRDLLGMAGLHGFQVRQHDFSKQVCEGCNGFVHEQILSRNPLKHIVTAGERR